eukprot:COSAG01_NODE_16448_length_1235_cov_0.983289_1_plen_117_part_00
MLSPTTGGFDDVPFDTGSPTPQGGGQQQGKARSWDASPDDFGFGQHPPQRSKGTAPNLFGLQLPDWAFGGGGGGEGASGQGSAPPPSTQDANLFGIKMPSWVFGDGDSGAAAPPSK